MVGISPHCSPDGGANPDCVRSQVPGALNGAPEHEKVAPDGPKPSCGGAYTVTCAAAGRAETTNIPVIIVAIVRALSNFLVNFFITFSSAS